VLEINSIRNHNGLEYNIASIVSTPFLKHLHSPIIHNKGLSFSTFADEMRTGPDCAELCGGREVNFYGN
jgi:hypothetical protein